MSGAALGFHEGQRRELVAFDGIGVTAADFAPFLAIARRGTARQPFTAPAGQDRKAADQAYQKAEFERSIKYCRETLGLGLKST